ncbi:MAG: hypothetical protein JXB49_26125, partial [Bacteroidales bacterium]|nr:hypothetical protein [Bacteroidales bacterium]
GLRLNFGTRSKLILEVGGFADLSTGGKRFGTCHSYIPDENYVVTYKEFQFEEKGGLPSLAAANKPAYLMSLSRRMLLIVRQNFKIILPLVIISR